MNCEQVRAWLDDYHYGELDERQAGAMREHLKGCAGCTRELEMLDREADVYGAFAAQTESALDLPDDLWQRALARAAAAASPPLKRPRASWLSSLLPVSPGMRQAIAAVFLVAISISGTLMIVNHNQKDGPAAVRQTPAGDATAGKSLDAALQSIQRAEQEYLKAIQDLSAIVEKQKSTLDPMLIAQLQTNLKLIDDHIAATRQAYYAHPDDAELALFMLAAYGRKVELLQDLTLS